MRRFQWALMGMTFLFFSVAGCSCDEENEGDPIVLQIERAEQLIGGREATGRVGDFLLANDRARFIVQDAKSATGWGMYGGALVDLEQAPDEQSKADDGLQEIFVQCDLRAFEPTSAQIVNDGSNGEPGILRLIGRDAGIPVLDAILPRDPLEITITVDYVLAQESDTLEIQIRAKDERKTGQRELSCGIVLIPGDGLPLFVDRYGSDQDQSGGEQPYLAAAAWDLPSSYVLYREDGPVNVMLALSEAMPIAQDAEIFRANATLETQYRVSVGANGDVESALRAMRVRKADGIERRLVEVSLTKPDNLAVPNGDEVITFLDLAQPVGAQAVTAAKSDAEGIVRAELPLGSYQLQLSVQGRDVDTSETLEVPAGTEPLAATMAIATLGMVQVETRATDRLGIGKGPTPARAIVTDGHDSRFNSGRVFQKYMLSSDSFFLPEGEYTIHLSRGPEYEIDSHNITIRAGETENLSAEVQQVVDTDGWVAADLHTHCTRSIDSDAPRRPRVIGAVAEGLDILVATDHDTVTNHAPLVRELGLDEMLVTVPGIELSMLYGHMNAYPMPADEPEVYWKPGWAVFDEVGRYERTLQPQEMTDLSRTMGAEIVQLNHPRSGQGILNYLNYQDDTGISDQPVPDVDTLELLNGKRLDEYASVWSSWNSLIQYGQIITAVGSSDAHSEFNPLGSARTFIKSDTDDPKAVSTSQVWQALREGKAVAANGPFLRFTAVRANEEAGIGETLSGGGPIQLEVEVEAPSWMDVGDLALSENGTALITKMIEPEDADAERPALRFSGTFTATPTQDSYYILEVTGHAGVNNEPFFDQSKSISNPIFVDVDGDGFRYQR